jgi:hypothetical protein
MSNDDSMLGMSRRNQLAADVGFLMLKGAGYAALLVLAVWFSIAFLAWARFLLPPESQEALDPTPWTSMAIPERASDFATQEQTDVSVGDEATGDGDGTPDVVPPAD